MLFNSIEYTALLLATLCLYWITSSKLIRQLTVLTASIYFYMSWSRVFVLMLIGVILINWAVGFILEKKRSRYLLAGICIANLSLLAYFKYANFFIENLFSVLHFSGVTQSTPYHLSIILPLGISFYIFELISYQADLYQKKIVHERNLIVFSLFVLFFPHLIAGPICRAGQFMPQLHQLQRFDPAKLYSGIYVFVAGFSIKCGIADGLSPFVNVIFKSPTAYSGFDNLMASIGFGVQILCDFWGYSLMALGAALMFGYVLPPNFNTPYVALSIQDFWRRWHMTLSSWLRDYLYITLGGSRVDVRWKIQRNLALTMLLGGFWHGASWNFIIWGGIHGLALAINRGFTALPNTSTVVKIFRNQIVAWSLTMLIVFLGWIFFRATTLTEAISIIVRIASVQPDWLSTKLAPVFFELLLLYIPLQWLVHTTTYKSDITNQNPWRAAIAMAILVSFSLVYYVDGNQFIYFQF